jgi:hypothetical protein
MGGKCSKKLFLYFEESIVASGSWCREVVEQSGAPDEPKNHQTADSQSAIAAVSILPSGSLAVLKIPGRSSHEFVAQVRVKL